MKKQHIIEAANRAGTFNAMRQTLGMMHIEMTSLHEKGKEHLDTIENESYKSTLFDLKRHLEIAECIAIRLAEEDRKVTNEHLILVSAGGL